MTEAEHEEMRLKRIQEKNRRNQRKFRARQRVRPPTTSLCVSLVHLGTPFRPLTLPPLQLSATGPCLEIHELLM